MYTYMEMGEHLNCYAIECRCALIVINDVVNCSLTAFIKEFVRIFSMQYIMQKTSLPVSDVMADITTIMDS